MKKLIQAEIDTLLEFLLRLYQTADEQDIRRVAKSLFLLLSKYRFSTLDE